MNGVVTVLLTSQPDPQRRRHLPSDVAVIDELRRSVHAHGHHLTVLHDCLDEPDDERTAFVRVEPGGNPYWYRWALIADHLAGSDDGLVWCVDGTDVEMLNDPFPHMVPGVLYVGSEGERIGGAPFGWLRSTAPSMSAWLGAHTHEMTLNLGVVGGDRATVRALAAALRDAESSGDAYEMGVFQRIARQFSYETGPRIHTQFRAQDRSSSAWWRHK
jgi:hypothetical protein